MLCILGKIFTRYFDIFFHIFFSENNIGHFMQTVFLETVCMKCQILFSEKNNNKKKKQS